ncbi:MAG: helical backbone metal receptor [Candidatus Eremiobacteraeota bacterium]|nr:helical backbone metal receptor [Candidatus Eremiobacteraeota bacterium]
MKKESPEEKTTKITESHISYGYILQSHMSVISFFSFFFILIICFITTGTARSSKFPRRITDISGQNILLSSSPKRIITLGPSATEVTLSLAEESRIIAVSSASDYPPETKGKEKVGDIYLNYEKIVALRPDLVIVETTLYSRDVSKLRNLGITVLAVKSDTYDNFVQSTKLIGKSVGSERKSSDLLLKMKKNMGIITRRIRNVPDKKKPRVFIEIWNSPLMTAGSGTFINYTIENAGGINIAGDMTGYPQINRETLLLRNPDVIILTTSSRKDFIKEKHWRNIRAVKNGRVYSINPDIMVRPTPRLFEACRKLYNWFYPNKRIADYETRIME